MRKELAKNEGERKKFTAVFVRLGKKVNYKGYSEETVLLQHIKDAESQRTVTDHAWFSFTKGFQQLTLSEGITIEFEARIKEYTKGYVNRRYGIDKSKRDYRLSHPTKIKVVQT